jgi:hypothetical protein
MAQGYPGLAATEGVGKHSHTSMGVEMINS